MHKTRSLFEPRKPPAVSVTNICGVALTYTRTGGAVFAARATSSIAAKSDGASSRRRS